MERPLEDYPKGFYSEDLLPYFEEESRYLVLYGDNKSKNACLAASKILRRLLLEPAKHKILVIRKAVQDLRHSCYEAFKTCIQEWDIQNFFSINNVDLTITCLSNNNQVIFAAVDELAKIKCMRQITSIWIEEPAEISLADFKQIDLRLRNSRDTYSQIILTFNIADTQSWVYNYFFSEPERAGPLPIRSV